MRASWVYFIRPVGMAGPVKIGWSKSVETRLLQLTEWSPFPLEIAARIDGDRHIEARFHALFHDLRSHKEWFHASPRIDAVIADILAGAFDVQGLPPRIKEFRPQWSDERRAWMSAVVGLNRLRRAGVRIPAYVSDAEARYQSTRHPELAGRPVDRQIVQAFVAHQTAAAKPSSPSKQEAA